MLENVHFRATKLVDGLKNMDYSERLEKLDLPTFLHQRERGDTIQVWKHFNTHDPSTLIYILHLTSKPALVPTEDIATNLPGTD